MNTLSIFKFNQLDLQHTFSICSRSRFFFFLLLLLLCTPRQLLYSFICQNHHIYIFHLPLSCSATTSLSLSLRRSNLSKWNKSRSAISNSSQTTYVCRVIKVIIKFHYYISIVYVLNIRGRKLIFFPSHTYIYTTIFTSLG